MKLKNLNLLAIGLLLSSSNALADLKNDKITLKPNMTLQYNKGQKSVDSITDMFSEGEFYGRLRVNTFKWDWSKSAAGLDNKALGVGGSFVYKSAKLSGFSATVGLYTSQNPSFYRMEVHEVGDVKAGKDTFSRYDTDATGKFGMSVLGQAYLQYDVSKTSLKVGRQLFESVFTKSNDTKMIPNTFDGVSATIKELPQTTIQLAYFTAQKLRDHTSSHDVLAVNGWVENDDSAINKSLTTTLIGHKNELIIATITNTSVNNLKANLSVANVPDVITNVTAEAHYAIPVGSFKVVPGVRYMQQFDNLDTTANVACLKGLDETVGYKKPTDLDSSLLALRLDVKDKAFLARLGYSEIADEADIIAPWRGFPTGGFTRAMAQYNWYANTKTYMARVGYDFDKAGILDGFNIFARYAIQDFDDKKDSVQADTNILHVDAMQNIGDNLQAKVRVGLVSADDKILKSNGTSYKTDVSYNEYRFELNYFF
ncbi:OprD family outer membrane porin [Sulfurimonas sp.]|uniref:OprD family outer membrane porin n=1 Tax=Sulfurimonas sp. TaxID=2022749 RepID=UPI003564B434